MLSLLQKQFIPQLLVQFRRHGIVVGPVAVHIVSSIAIHLHRRRSTVSTSIFDAVSNSDASVNHAETQRGASEDGDWKTQELEVKMMMSRYVNEDMVIPNTLQLQDELREARAEVRPPSLSYNMTILTSVRVDCSIENSTPVYTARAHECKARFLPS